MNKTISTRIGLITGIVITAFNLLLLSQKVAPNSAIALLQFLWLFIGIIASCFMLQKFYAGITFFDFFKHCLKTISTTMVIVIIANTILFFVFKEKNTPNNAITMLIMKTIFSYSISGVLSSFFSSFIFNTFTKK